MHHQLLARAIWLSRCGSARRREGRCADSTALDVLLVSVRSSGGCTWPVDPAGACDTPVRRLARPHADARLLPPGAGALQAAQLARPGARGAGGGAAGAARAAGAAARAARAPSAPSRRAPAAARSTGCWSSQQLLHVGAVLMQRCAAAARARGGPARARSRRALQPVRRRGAAAAPAARAAAAHGRQGLLATRSTCVCGAGRVHAPRRGRAGGAELVARCGRSRSGHWIRFSAPRVVSPAPPWRWDPAARHTHAVSRPEGEGTRQGGGRGPADGRSPESERARACACQRPAPPAAAGRRRARAGPASRVHTRRAVWRTGDRVLVFFESPHLTSHHASPRPDTSVSYILYIFIEIRIYRTALSLYTIVPKYIKYVLYYVSVKKHSGPPL